MEKDFYNIHIPCYLDSLKVVHENRRNEVSEIWRSYCELNDGLSQGLVTSSVELNEMVRIGIAAATDVHEEIALSRQGAARHGQRVGCRLIAQCSGDWMANLNAESNGVDACFERAQ